MEVDAKQEEATVAQILEGLAREIHASVGVRMHRLGVSEWEVKLWIASSGQANGAWRFVVTNVTGHTCTTHVSVTSFLGACKFNFLFCCTKGKRGSLMCTNYIDCVNFFLNLSGTPELLW